MALESENIIQEKIKSFENNVNPAWNKEWVWSRIETPSKRKTGFIWYAAAAIVISMISISLYLSSLKFENEMMTQLNQIETLMNEIQMNLTYSDNVEEKCIEEPTILRGFGGIKATKVTKLSSGKNNFSKIITPVMDTSTFKVEIPSLSNLNETLAFEETLEMETIAEETFIKPIIGKIPQHQNSTMATQSKEIRIKLFQSDEFQKSLITDAREYKISAKINHN